MCGARGLDAAAVAEACLRGGARLLQVRDKEGGGAAFLALAERIVAIARAHGAAVVINDRADIAWLSGADGVHVGQDDLPVETVRSILGPDAIVGLSTHDAHQIDEALDGSASYIAVGPIFASATKPAAGAERGLGLVRYAAGRGKPVVAIGGITAERARAVIDAGASSIAVVSDLLVTADPESRTRRFVAELSGNAGQ